MIKFVDSSLSQSIILVKHIMQWKWYIKKNLSLQKKYHVTKKKWWNDV